MTFLPGALKTNFLQATQIIWNQAYAPDFGTHTLPSKMEMQVLPFPRIHFKLLQDLRESPSISAEHQLSQKHRMKDGFISRLHFAAKGEWQVKFLLCLLKAHWRTLFWCNVVYCFPLWEPYKQTINELVNPMTVNEVYPLQCHRTGFSESITKQ